MPTCISILRGINVSGHKLIKMNLLKEMFERMGFENVKTYIQSGNFVFNCKPTDTAMLGKRIADEILSHFGFEVPVIVLEKDELKQVSAQNMFIERGEDITKLHVTFLSAEPQTGLLDDIDNKDYLPDAYYLRGKAVYLFCPDGYGNTKLSNNFFEKKLKVHATTRNWKTILELVKMSEG